MTSTTRKDSQDRWSRSRPRVPSTRKGKEPLELAPIPMKRKRSNRNQEKRGS